MCGRKIHFLGIGGVGMAGLAVLMKADGNEVDGCDLHVTARTRWLERAGIPVAVGHDPAHVERADLVVVTPAVRADNAERLAAVGRIRFRGEMLAEIVNGRDSIAVCGSHGKTTTATFVAKLLKALGEDVAWCIGGETGDFPVASPGTGPLVVEADESDGTLALYRAKTLVVNKCEYDHPDHFKTVEDYFACYETAKRNAGTVIDAESLALDGWEISVVGEHNRKNARAAIEVALRRGHSHEAIASVLPQVVAALPDRRFQPLADGVYTDYAHHPTEMKCAVSMARQVCRGTLRVLFQPHRYSRTKALLKDFPAAFEGADELVLCPTYAAFESPVEGGGVADLYRECRGRIAARLFLARSCEEAWTHARRSMRTGDVTLVLGAGDIVDKLRELPGRKIWIGAGTNTWKTDLDIGETYVKPEGPMGRTGAELGIPWMAGIPGTLGGWIRMNAGAFGHSIGELVSRVRVDGRWLTAAECGFGYRQSYIVGEIQDVEWDEEKLAAAKLDGTDYLARRHRFPAHTKGSVFKNPKGDFAGRLLEEAGAKHLRVGGAFVWREHANVIVAPPGEATPSDVLALAQLMHDRVLLRFGVNLEPEVCGLP